MKHILLVAWEYPGQNSAQGQALVRRIGQLLHGFLKHGFKVTFLYHDKKGEAGNQAFVRFQEGNLTRFAIAYQSPKTAQNVWHRKINTLKEVATLGDFTGHWAKTCLSLIDSGKIVLEHPQAVIAFSSPKGPIFLGSTLARKYKAKFVVDYQDPYCEGTDKGILKRLCSYWTRKVLAHCDMVTIVNKFWADELRGSYSNKIQVIDHAIPNIAVSKSETKEKFVYYCGNVNESIQDIEPFMLAFDKYSAEDSEVFLKLSVNAQALEYFNKVIAKYQLKHIRVKNTGWISIDQVYQNVANSWFLLLVSLHTTFKKGVASKFYEYMAFDRPIMITGNDSGGFVDFLQIHGHPDCILRNAEQVYEALSTGKASLYFRPEKCAVAPITEQGLIQKYLDIIG